MSWEDGSSAANGSQRPESQADESQRTLQHSQELTAPPPPPRPSLSIINAPGTESFRLSARGSRPKLQSQATTALSLTGVQFASRATSASHHSSPGSRTVSRVPSIAHFQDSGGAAAVEGDDSASLKSYAPSLDTRLDGESILGNATRDDHVSAAWSSLTAHLSKNSPFDELTADGDNLGLHFQHEFDELDEVDVEGLNEEALLAAWKAKLKHFFILSASGKPIYSRHGDDRLISSYIGIAQTIISFYQGEGDSLKGFTAGDARLVFLPKGPLNLVAVSRLNESDTQLKVQLESLYMQILSTLTLPSMERMFSHRPSTDLRRPLEGTDVLLDGLADGFTRGSPSTLLSALECLRLRKSQRKLINDSFLKVRSPNLLYGLIVAAGRLVSVVRPKKHSLHPGDLHLIFNMLFEADGVKAGGGENWIPICLPGFNNTGFLYMYVSFFSTSDETPTETTTTTTSPPSSNPRGSASRSNDELAIVLISANKESFYELRQMRDNLLQTLEKNSSLTSIKLALRQGTPSCAELVPGTALEHFLFKSRANVQFTMPSLAPQFASPVARRKLFSLYAALHEQLHSRTSHLKVQHAVSRLATALAWETPLFELYCVAGPQTSRAALAQGANRVVQWVRREEERVFIIGGAVF